MTNSTWTKVCSLEEITPLGARVLDQAEGNVAVFRTADDEVFALLDRCPHKGGPLSQGIVFGKQVACPLHNWTISLTDGAAAAPDAGCAQRYLCKVESGIVFIDLTSQISALATTCETAKAA